MCTPTLHRRARLGTVLIALALLTTPPPASAQESCDTATPMEGQRLLRRLSLDLRGAIPSRREIEAQVGRAELDDATIEAFLDSPEFLQVMRRYHADMLWPNIDQVELIPDQNVLMPVEQAPGDVLWLSPLRSVFMRTISGQLYGLCKNEPAEFDAQGRIVAEPVTNAAGEILSYQEGYVMVEPWWAPGDAHQGVRLRCADLGAGPGVPGSGRALPVRGPVL
jgi:hypothetical protein